MFEIQGNSITSEDTSGTNTRQKDTGINPFSRTIAFNTSVLNGMSHEMRTQMNSIISLAFLLKDKSLVEPERDEFVNQIYSTCEQLIALFENYLESAIVDTGIPKSDELICNHNNLLDGLFSEFREVLRKTGKESIELVTEIQFSESHNIFIDKIRVYRILRCLFQNSLQNTDSGYIKTGYFSSENEVTFYVLDSGQGYLKTREFLNTNDLADSLSQYHDLSSAVNITLAKKLIQLLGGTFNIQCNGTSGSGIYFSIPVRLRPNNEITINKYINSIISS